MIIGIPKETKELEGRVALTPSHVRELIEKYQQQVFVEADAGLKSGYSTKEYADVGAKISGTNIYKDVDLIVKVKEPLGPELKHNNKATFGFFHFNGNPKLKNDFKGNPIPFEDILVNGESPILKPMSEIAGRVAITEGVRLMQRKSNILVSGVAGVKPANILIIGAGHAGQNAAYMASSLRANVTILDINLNKLSHIEYNTPANVRGLFSNRQALENELPNADLVIGAVMTTGSKTPQLITKDDVYFLMKNSSVFVDISIDEGGCCELSQPSIKPYERHGITFLCMPNLPALVCKTSTIALSNAIFPYVVELAEIHKACANMDTSVSVFKSPRKALK